jgi:chromosome segregation ATPase
MRKWFLSFLLSPLLLASCTTTQTAPRFEKPSTAAIAKAHGEAISHIKSARTKAEQIEKQAPESLKLPVASLRVDLDNALTSLDTGEGARKQLESQLQQQTDKANKLANDFDHSSAEILSLKSSRHRWVKYLAFSMLANIAAVGWIFRKPIFAALAASI